jgi:hypothetical protein
MNFPIDAITLPNGLVFTVTDTTRRYYEDYHLVRLEVVCDVPLLPAYFSGDGEFAAAALLLGDGVRYCRILEKMGVPFSAIDAAREGLLQGFHESAQAYMATDAFPGSLVQVEYEKAREKQVRRTVRQ